MIRVMIDGHNYVADNERDLIMQLKLEDWTTYDGVESYKANVTRRVEVFTGETIAYANDREFLLELFRIEFLDLLAFSHKKIF